MNALRWVFLFTFLSVQMSVVGAEGNAPAGGGQVPEAKPTEKAVDKLPTATLDNGLPFSMGDIVKVKVKGEVDKGKYQISIANSTAMGASLVLDDVVMKNIDTPTVMRDKDGNLTLSFRLIRNAENDDSRKEWNKLLEKQDDYEMKLPVALAINPSTVIPVETPDGKGISFSITDSYKVYSTLGGGLLLFVLLYWWLVNNKSALRDSKDGYYSLGKSQMAFWGLLIPLTFVGIWINTGIIEHIPDQVLILLGISGTTGLLAIIIESGKNEGDSNKVSTTTISPSFFKDICDDGNGISVHRLQTVMWTVILGVIFVSEVMCSISMPTFDNTLLILMGISNSIYLGFKFPEKEKA